MGYNPDEPRDDQGRWTSDGGSGPKGSLARKMGGKVNMKSVKQLSDRQLATIYDRTYRQKDREVIHKELSDREKANPSKGHDNPRIKTIGVQNEAQARSYYNPLIAQARKEGNDRLASGFQRDLDLRVKQYQDRGMKELDASIARIKKESTLKDNPSYAKMGERKPLKLGSKTPKWLRNVK